jgi:hypothetical protein
MYFSTLELGNPTDAKTWEQGCRSLGLKGGSSIMTSKPGLDRLRSFFAAEPDWVYFSGHFAGGELWGDNGDAVEFKHNRVVLSSGDDSTELHKGDGFRMHANVTLVVWGGCSACREPARVRWMRELFDNPTILGYAGSTGWKINDAMLGGGFIRANFFENLRRNTMAPYYSPDFVDAWMGAAQAGYGGGPMEGLFRAVDAQGQMWELQGGKIVKGASV